MWRCEDEKMWRWEDVKMRGCEDERMWRWEDVKMRRCEDEKMWRWEDVKMRGCEDKKMWRWEDVKMRRCEGERMWRWEDVLQTPTIGRTLRSDALGKKRENSKKQCYRGVQKRIWQFYPLNTTLLVVSILLNSRFSWKHKTMSIYMLMMLQ